MGSPLHRSLLNVLSWALPKPTSFSCLDTRKRSKRKSRLMFRADPLSAYSLNVENSPSAQTVRRFSSLTFAQAGTPSRRVGRSVLCFAQNQLRIKNYELR